VTAAEAWAAPERSSAAQGPGRTWGQRHAQALTA